MHYSAESVEAYLMGDIARKMAERIDMEIMYPAQAAALRMAQDFYATTTLKPSRIEWDGDEDEEW